MQKFNDKAYSAPVNHWHRVISDILLSPHVACNAHGYSTNKMNKTFKTNVRRTNCMNERATS